MEQTIDKRAEMMGTAKISKAIEGKRCLYVGKECRIVCIYTSRH
ncbi:MAG: hypothetical protein RR632_04835 [Christensenella sp.]